MTLSIDDHGKHEPKLPAFPYQIDALQAIRNLEYAAVFHEPGLGKSKIALDLALTWLRQNDVDSVLLVTKKTLIKNWEKEIRIHSHLFPLILNQDRRANYLALNSAGRVYLAHYEVLRSELGRMRLFLKTRKVGIICDEAQKLKNPDSDLFRVFSELRTSFNRRVILTGTPIANRPYDIWALINFLDGGEALGNDYRAFKHAVDLDASLEKDHAKRAMFEGELASLFQRISAFSVRETKESAGIVLPGKVIENVVCEPEDLQEQLYATYRSETQAAVVQLGVLRFDMLDEVLKRLLRLVQVASNPRLVTEEYRRDPGKLPVLLDLVRRSVGAGSKVIVWTSFVDNAIWLHRELREFQPAVVHGKVAIDIRNKALTRFQENAECRVLVATPASAKEGLTLTVANVAIFFDRSFSLDDYLQAQDRIHRITQNQTCYIYNLILRDTVDAWVDELLVAKRLAARLGQGDISIDEYRATATYSFGRALADALGYEHGDDTGV